MQPHPPKGGSEECDYNIWANYHAGKVPHWYVVQVSDTTMLPIVFLLGQKELFAFPVINFKITIQKIYRSAKKCLQ